MGRVGIGDWVVDVAFGSTVKQVKGFVAQVCGGLGIVGRHTIIQILMLMIMVVPLYLRFRGYPC